MKLHIKNMVCSRCKIVVKSVFENMGINPVSVDLGEVELKNDIQEIQKNELLKKLHAVGFDLIDDRKSKTINKIKTLIIDLVQNKNNHLKQIYPSFYSKSYTKTIIP